MKSLRCAVILILALIICISLFHCRDVPEKETIFRIMTYNLHHCEGEDGIYSVKRIAQFIKELEADIILCQEVDNEYSERSKLDNQPKMLREMLGFHDFYGPNIGKTYGNLILSRYPITISRNVSLPNPEDKEPRGVIVSTITIQGQTLTFIDTHLSAFSKVNRDVQVEFLRGLVKEQQHPTIFGADFNCRPSGQLKPLLDDGILVSTRHNLLNLGEGIDDILVPVVMRERVIQGKVVENVYSDHPAYWIDIDFGKTHK